MPEVGLAHWARGRSLAEFEAFHRALLATMVEQHGMAGAMQVVGKGLEWMASIQQASGGGASPSGSAVLVTPLARWKRAVQLLPTMPDPWADRQLHRLPLRRGVRQRYDPVRQAWATDDLLFRMEPDSFTQGSMRNCFRMKAFLSGVVHHWDRANNLIAKQYLNPSGKSDEYHRDVQTQMQAKQYSDEWNRLNPPKKVDFIQCWVLRTAGESTSEELFSVECLLPGTYAKYNSNAGFVADEFLRNTPHAFSHWTWEVSQGRAIVVDIQGVGDLYTDPQIHTADHQGFGSGNTGLRGISLFFASHKCNPICQQLRLKPFEQLPEYGYTEASAPRSPTTMSPRLPLLPPQPPLPNLDVEPNRVPLIPGIYAKVHEALAEQHGRHMKAGEDTIAPGIATSSAAGIFHLKMSAVHGNPHAQLLMALLYQHLRPRKSAFAVLMINLKDKLPYDPVLGMKYTLLAAQRGVVGAMAAAAYAHLKGIGVEASGVAADWWYRQAAECHAAHKFAAPEYEEEAGRLPGAKLTLWELYAALARLHEHGAAQLQPSLNVAVEFYAAAAELAKEAGALEQHDEFHRLASRTRRRSGEHSPVSFDHG